ncbi:MAG: FAD/NAD(P)-binding protein [Burkholderiales bacterium]|nr:FAD/NAD(P)-binding protein [Burkholderiales bacterium]
MAAALHAAAEHTLPQFMRVRARRQELADTWTLEIDPGGPFEFLPGQFNMLYAFGIGEVPISISGDPARPERLVHTVRAVGRTTQALAALGRGARLGVRGPYGAGWPLDAAPGADVVVLAGGIGLAPLRPALYRLLAERARFGRVSLLYGSRSPQQLLYASELRRWRSRFDIEVEVTVDTAGPEWRGNLGVVTKLLRRSSFDPANSMVLVCGPEVMMRHVATDLAGIGVPPARVFISMERNMKCAVGFCGHCQYGSAFVCRDGPVVPLERLERLLGVREL